MNPSEEQIIDVLERLMDTLRGGTERMMGKGRGGWRYQERGPEEEMRMQGTALNGDG